MMNMEELVSAIEELQQEDLHAWMKQSLVTPQPDADTTMFSEKECARVRLLCTLYYELDLNAEAIPVVMSLIDQLHESRERLFRLSGAIMAQDRNTRSAILDTIKKL